jgi:hypothetical protein
MATDRPIAARMTPPGLAVLAEDVGVHDPERRCGQGHEDRRVPRDRVRDAFAASQAGGDEVVGVATVALRARAADRLAPVAARLPEDPIRLAVGRPDLTPAAVPVAHVNTPLQADGACAISGRAQLRLERRVVRPGHPVDDTGQQRVLQQRPGCHQRISPPLDAANSPSCSTPRAVRCRGTGTGGG